MIDPRLAAEGLHPEFVEKVRARIRAAILPRALDYYTEGGTAYAQANPLLKKAEMSVNYYDYQACGVSVLGTLASEGNEQALALVRRIFDNTRFYMDEWRPKEGYTTPIRRAQLHLVLCYERIHGMLSPAEASEWRALLIRTAEDMLHHFHGLRERTPALDNRGFGTGINHVAIAAEGIYKTGAVLGRPDWQTLAGDFTDRLVAYGHPEGYFEEHTNDAREGGPSLVYTPLTAGCAYLVQKWRGRADRERFARCGALYRSLVDARFHALAFTDERANPHGLGSYGIALHALTPEGRGFLRMALDPDHGTVRFDGMSLEGLARMDVELGHVEFGDGAVPEPLREGTFRIAMPLGVTRSGGWTMGLSAMRALNREIAPKSDYALDRQTLLHISHERAGVILSGLKSKHDPLWSTVRIGDDAYPVRTGDLRMEAGRMVAQVFYETFSVEVDSQSAYIG
ncbi:MAG: hypothetical protein EXS64_18705 [Candidatus Latescibacteria bacterium]|nr:hypothetical protein [Candidatus Latescibacterota bacterium]